MVASIDTMDVEKICSTKCRPSSGIPNQWFAEKFQVVRASDMNNVLVIAPKYVIVMVNSNMLEHPNTTQLLVSTNIYKPVMNKSLFIFIINQAKKILITFMGKLFLLIFH